MDLLAEFQAHLASLSLPADRALVAVSGGPDSLVLLDLLVRSSDMHRLELVVAHVDHGISPESAKVAARVAAFASERGLRCESVALALGPRARETEARLARYAWLGRARAHLGAGIVFTAHHADDQAETVLMRILRGSGPAGLAAMRPISRWLVRPLLPFRRGVILAYARARGLPAWIDPANSDPAHLRSWIRVEVLPFLRRKLPEPDQHLLGTAAQAARDRRAWDALLDALAELDLRADADGFSVAGAPLAGYDSALAESLIRALARRAGCTVGPGRAAAVMALLAKGESGTSVPLGAGWRAEVDFGRLRILRGTGVVADVPWALLVADVPWALQGMKGQGTWGRWRLRWRPESAPERQERAALVAWFVPDALEVRGWSAGDRVRPLAGTGRRLVARCFQDARVSRRRREGWPVLAGDGGVVWIPGVCRSDALLPHEGAEAVRVDAEYA